MNPKIEVRKLNVFYGDFQALHDVGLRIKHNQITAFIGPSGCGKTTLLKTLDRMNDLVDGTRVEGQVLLDGEDICARRAKSLIRPRNSFER